MTSTPRWLALLAIFVALVAASLTFAGTPADRSNAGVAHAHVDTPGFLAASQPSPPGQFLETFDGVPSAPQTYANPHGWDITPTGLNTRQNGAATQSAQHGPACDPPGFPYTPSNTHPIGSQSDQVFICNNHLMTANGLTGYGAVYLVPPATADFSGGTATIRFDMSTLRTTSRDWVYFTLTPFEGHNKFAYNGTDQAIPPDNINVKLEGTNAFSATQRIGGGGDLHLDGDSATTWEMVQAANGLTEDAARRDTFEIDISATHLRVCITGNNTGQQYDYLGKHGFCWVDSDLRVPLAPSVWGGRAVFLITHVTYNPEKSCSAEEDRFFIVHNPVGDAQCPPNTWHWDNVSINPATSFTIINPQQQYAGFNDPSGTNMVNFATPAPPGARLSYIAAGDCNGQRFSVDGGAHWITAVPQPTTTQCQHPENGGEYWTPIPAGTTSVKFTGQTAFGVWSVGGIAIWAGDGGTLPPPPGPPPVAPPPGPPGPPSSPPSSPPVVLPPPGASFHSVWVDQTAYPVIAAGTSATVTLRFRNTGADAWQVGVPGRQVNLGIASDATTFRDLGMANGWLSANRPATAQESVVGPGQLATFTFRVRAPSAYGVYELPLRLVADGVTWLDDQGVFIVVTSDSGYHSAWVAQTPWPALRASEVTAPIAIVFRNTGSKAWQKGGPGQANLGVAGDDTSWSALGIGWLSPNRPAAQSETTVAPAANATFLFQIRAPATPGTYRLSLRPVVDGVAWLEDEGVYVLVTVVP